MRARRSSLSPLLLTGCFQEFRHTRYSRRIASLLLCLLLVSGFDGVASAFQTEKIFPGELAGIDQSEAMLIDDDQPPEVQQGFLMRLLYRAGRTAEKSQAVSRLGFSLVWPSDGGRVVFNWRNFTRGAR